MKNKILEIISFLSKEEIHEIEKAINLAEKAHKGQYRKGGEEYFNHPL